LAVPAFDLPQFCLVSASFAGPGGEYGFTMPSRHDPPVEHLDAAIDELYAAQPEDFIRLRDSHVKAAKERGDSASARQLSALRRPSIGAWLTNQLVRAVPDDLHALLDVGAELREAQADLRGEELRALSQQRRQAVNALVRRARQVAVELGRPIGEEVARDVEQTLEAALSDPVAAEQVSAGRLTTPLVPTAEFGPGRPQLRVVRGEPAPTSPARRNASPRAEAANKARAAKAAIELRAAQQAVEEAERAVTARTTEQAALESKAGELAARATQLRRQIDELSHEVLTINDGLTALQPKRRAARQQVADAERTARTARRRLDVAQSAAADAMDDEATRT
jgi:outer membrane murein-binding lipoprotein Lpp